MVQVIKLELAHNRPALLATTPGDVIGGYPIVQTVAGGSHVTVAVPDSWADADIDTWANGLHAAGLLHDDGELWRYEKTLEPLGYPSIAPQDVLAQWVAGDTFGSLGVDPTTQARGNWGRGVKVALLDTGLDGGHVYFDDMQGRLEGDLRDDHGHGTHCGGTLTGKYGVAPGVHLRVWNVLPGGSGTESGIARGIDQAVAWGAQVISMSLGGAGTSGVINQSVQRARQQGVYVSSAAGNGSSVQPVGSPAQASSAVVMASDRSSPARWANFTDGRHVRDAQLPRVGCPGVQIVSAQAGGGERAMDGSSMACPHHAGFVALLMGAGLSAAECEQYVASHMGAVPDGKTSRLSEDFGAGEGPMPEPPNDEIEQARDELDSAIGHLDVARYIERDRDPNAAWTYVGEASRILGIARERLGKAEGAPGPTPPPSTPPTLPSPQFACVYGTYNGHGLAVDAYPGVDDVAVNWGPHHGIPLVAPVNGRVEVYQFGTPLESSVWGALEGEARAVYGMNWLSLAGGWTCRASPQQVMYVAVFYPSQPLIIDGQRIGHLHYGHVRSNIKTGLILQGEQFATVWDSGVRWEPQLDTRAAHVHCAAGAGTQLSPNGDLPGRLAAIAQGWALTDIGFAPGPQEYQSGLWAAGRRRSDFTQAGRVLPPVPS